MENTEMPEAEAFVRAMENIGNKLDAGLDRVHKRIDEIGTAHSEANKTTAVFVERFSNHMEREDIHQEAKPSCQKSDENEKVIKDHLNRHSSIVKKDIGAIVGAAIIGAMLLAGAGYIATLVFGGAS